MVTLTSTWDAGSNVYSERWMAQTAIEQFDFQGESLHDGPTAVTYRRFVKACCVQDREAVYNAVVERIAHGDVKPSSLLAFAAFERYRLLVSRAARDYLRYRPYEIRDEFAGVDEILSIIVHEATKNRGALLAGLVSVGDRRVNAVARTVRSRLNKADIRDFSRVQHPRMLGLTVEFCLDWIAELRDTRDYQVVSDLACALMLMAVHDEHGVVELPANDEEIGFWTRARTSLPFSTYYDSVKPLMMQLGTLAGFHNPMTNLMEIWDQHRHKITRTATVA